MENKLELDIFTIKCKKGSRLFKGKNGRLLVLSPDTEEITIYDKNDEVAKVDLSHLPYLHNKVAFEYGESLIILGDSNCYNVTEVLFDYSNLDRPYCIDFIEMETGRKEILSYKDKKYIIVENNTIYVFNEDYYFLCKTPVKNNPNYKGLITLTNNGSLVFPTEVTNFIFNGTTNQWDFLDENLTSVLIEDYTEDNNHYEICAYIHNPNVISISNSADKESNFLLKLPGENSYIISSKNCYLIEYVD